MGVILINALGFILIILTGFFLKKIKVLAKEDGTVISKIILNVTLPAVIIQALKGAHLTSSLLLLIISGLFFNLIFVLFAAWIWRKKNPIDRAFMMHNIASYNLGNFTMPFMQTFFPASIPYVIMFDIGNAFMLFGGTPILVNQINHFNEEKITLKKVIKTFMKSIPFMSYVVMIALALLSIELPEGFHSIVQLFANANGFLSMFMIGLFLDFTLPRQELKKITQILSARYSLAIVSSALIYFLLPIDPTIKIILMILVLSPIGTIATIHSTNVGVRRESAGFISSMAIMISFTLIVCVLLFLS